MNAETYYAILGVPENASRDEIKRAYRDLIRQVHPDSVPSASPYWKRASEEKSKEINEAYHFLTDAGRRSRYDEQLARNRQRHAPASPAWQTEAEVTLQHLSNSRSPSAAYREREPEKRYEWQALVRWADEYRLLGACLAATALVLLLSLFIGLRHSKTATVGVLASDGFYSAFPCLDQHAAVSPIDGKPCPKTESKTPESEIADAKPPAKLTTPRWFYVTPHGVRALGRVPDEDLCKRLDAKNSVACEASLKFCPQGTLSRNCVSYSKWKKSNAGPPRVEKAIPAWPSE
jgi:DnaJ domain